MSEQNPKFAAVGQWVPWALEALPELRRRGIPKSACWVLLVMGEVAARTPDRICTMSHARIAHFAGTSVRRVKEDQEILRKAGLIVLVRSYPKKPLEWYLAWMEEFIPNFGAKLGPTRAETAGQHSPSRAMTTGSEHSPSRAMAHSPKRPQHSPKRAKTSPESGYYDIPPTGGEYLPPLGGENMPTPPSSSSSRTGSHGPFAPPPPSESAWEERVNQEENPPHSARPPLPDKCVDDTVDLFNGGIALFRSLERKLRTLKFKEDTRSRVRVSKELVETYNRLCDLVNQIPDVEDPRIKITDLADIEDHMVDAFNDCIHFLRDHDPSWHRDYMARQAIEATQEPPQRPQNGQADQRSLLTRGNTTSDPDAKQNGSAQINNDVPYETGDRLAHPKYGMGTVLPQDDPKKTTVQFDLDGCVRTFITAQVVLFPTNGTLYNRKIMRAGPSALVGRESSP